MAKNTINDAITVAQAASHSGLSKRHVRLLLEKGLIIGKKIGRDWITTKQEVNRYLVTNPRPGRKPNKD